MVGEFTLIFNYAGVLGFHVVALVKLRHFANFEHGPHEVSLASFAIPYFRGSKSLKPFTIIKIKYNQFNYTGVRTPVIGVFNEGLRDLTARKLTECTVGRTLYWFLRMECEATIEHLDF